ncbi:MAG TPA: chromate resistance protein ChrB domain-containing protein [Candidatus Dormibacteraeota bacterium]|nr:chromate resistance protein ChrB domain-containing protein [Candidatus Dormibacteraeota bacterium]
MKWMTRKSIRFVEPDQVAVVQARDRATGFDAPGATYPHKDARGRCSFEALVEEHRPDDPALRALAHIVRGADFPEEIGLTPESAGLQTISRGFPLVVKDDHETVAKAAFLYDALYEALRRR